MMKLNDVRDYAKEKGMCETEIERLIDEIETDGNGNLTDDDFNDICFGIDCETE